MVADSEIFASNALINDATAPRVSVFVGGTSGLGQLTIRALVGTGASVRIYLVGRKSSAERSAAFIAEMQTINPKAEIIWTEAEYSLLAETKRACDFVKSRESRVDLLFLTAGYAPFGGREETAEGIDTAQSLEYYSRMLCIQILLPLLRAAEAPRVVSILAGGMERVTSIDLDDIDLKKPGNFSGVRAQSQFGPLNTVTMDKFAHDNPDITFVHAWPGWVSTGNVDRGWAPGSLWSWFVRLFLRPLIGFFSINHDTAGQRHLFEATSAFYGGKGIPWKGDPGVNVRGEHTTGLFLVNFRANCTPNLKVIPALRERAQQKVWEHTQEVLGPYL
ncbi:hypothetical protein QBC47DRAFT_366907 [Echria macrotheca]|uniref:Uncharacterized protein n=1 Tax=Echria macrotheca TaxID=438768 RepID=A0AAJ0BNZ2_9PEZI|nr:hypothetical protein QBC47DRAFT_366907 [Echria macrotheca]